MSTSSPKRKDAPASFWALVGVLVTLTSSMLAYIIMGIVALLFLALTDATTFGFMPWIALLAAAIAFWLGVVVCRLVSEDERP